MVTWRFSPKTCQNLFCFAGGFCHCQVVDPAWGRVGRQKRPFLSKHSRSCFLAKNGSAELYFLPLHRNQRQLAGYSRNPCHYEDWL